MQVERRDLLASAAGLVVSLRAGHAVAATKPAEFFTEGALANNPVAKMFVATPALNAPATRLVGDDRVWRWADLTGKVRIISLWSEWCAPCVAEIADLAALHRRYRGPNFEIIAVLTASNRKRDYAQASAFLGARRGSMPLLVEPDGGATLLTTLAMANGSPSLPCNLIVDRNAVIRARSLGFAPLRPRLMPGHVLTGEEKTELMAGTTKSMWASAAAHTFISHLLRYSLV